MAITDEAVVSRLQEGVAPNAVDNSDEPYAMQSLCMDCYENVRLVVFSSMRSTDYLIQSQYLILC